MKRATRFARKWETTRRHVSYPTCARSERSWLCGLFLRWPSPQHLHQFETKLPATNCVLPELWKCKPKCKKRTCHTLSSPNHGRDESCRARRILLPLRCFQRKHWQSSPDEREHHTSAQLVAPSSVPFAGYSLLHPSVRLEHGSDNTVLLSICTLLTVERGRPHITHQHIGHVASSRPPAARCGIVRSRRGGARQQ